MPSRGRRGGGATAAALLTLLLSPLLMLPRVEGQIGGADVESQVLGFMTRSLTQFPCTRLINMTGDVGCSSGPAGATGFLYLVETTADLTAFMNLGSSSVLRTAVLAPALAVMPTDAVRSLAKLPWLAGIIMLPAPLSPTGFSPEVQKLPRGFSPDWGWNADGQGLLAER